MDAQKYLLQNQLINRCTLCQNLYTEYQNQLNLCPKAKVYIDFHGALVAKHTPDKHFDFILFVNFLSITKQLKWKDIFLRIWSLI